MLPTPNANRGSLQAAHPDQEIINFSPGPITLPAAVRKQVSEELFDWHGTGLGAIEFSHRAPEFRQIMDDAEASLRKVLEVPDDFAVLFTHAGGHGQFAAVPLNLAAPNEDGSKQIVDYVISGNWSRRAATEAAKFADVRVVAEDDRTFPENWQVTEGAAYVYICSNETVGGVEVMSEDFPDVGPPLIVDMSSDMMLKKIPWNRVGVAFAITSKNLGFSGLTITVVRKDLLERKAHPHCPGVLDYSYSYETKGCWNTPPTFNIWVTQLMADYVIELGGMDFTAKATTRKQEMFLAAIDASNGFYKLVASTNKKYLSRINLPFVLTAGEKCEEDFVEGARQRNIVGLRTMTVFGMPNLRVSLYVAVPEHYVQKLTDWMKEFQATWKPSA